MRLGQNPEVEERILNILRLTLTRDVGATRFARLIQAFGSADAALRCSPAQLAAVKSISIKLAEEILAGRSEERAEAEIKRAEERGIELIPIGSDQYPALLAEIPDPPPLLYCLGNSELLHKICIAIVGTRHPSFYGQFQAERFARALAQLGIVVVSGLAYGVDAAGHTGALAADGETIAVMGTGLDVIYPVPNEKLARRIEGQGALVSELPLGTTVRKGNFPVRNRIISGLARGVLVVEAPYNSGALITARYALEQNREIFAVPGRIDSELSRGCHQLIKDGAKLTERVEDIVTEIAPTLSVEAALLQKERQAKLPKQEELVFSTIDNEPSSVDQIITKSGLLPAEVNASLLNLQLKKLIEQLPGNRFARKEF